MLNLTYIFKIVFSVIVLLVIIWFEVESKTSKNFHTRDFYSIGLKVFLYVFVFVSLIGWIN